VPVTALTPNELLEFLLNIAPVAPVYLRGAPGGAKTSIVRQFCATVGLDCVSLNGSTCQPEDVIGLPIPNHAERITEYYPPARLARKSPYCLFLDDFPNAKKEVQRAFYTLFQDHCTDSFQMAPGSIVLAAGNRIEDLAHVNPVSSALINRCFVVDVLDSASDWISWAEGANLHALVIAYIRMRSDHLRSRPSANEEPFSSPRTWELLSRGLKAFGDGIFKKPRMFEACVRGALLSEHATQFMAFAKLQERQHDLAKILKGDLKWPREPAERDLLYFLAQSFRAHLAKELPADSTNLKDHHRKTAHNGKALLKDLAVISEEIAQMVISEEQGVAIPGWLLTEIVRDLPRLAAKKA